MLELFNLPKNIKKTFFQTRQLCHGAILMSRPEQQFRKFTMLYVSLMLNPKDVTELETCEKIYF